MEHLSEIISAVVASLVTAGLILLFQHLRKPWFIPWDSKEWSEETKRKMQKAGWGTDEMDFIHESHVVKEENQRRKIVKVGFPPRVVKSQFRGRDIFFMMKKP